MFFSIRSVSLLALVGLAASASALSVRDASSLTELPEAAEVFAKSLLAQANVGNVEGRAMRPKARRHAAGQCSVGSPQCCNQVVHDQAKKDVFAALAGIKELTGPIALDCFQLPVNVIGAAVAAQNFCKSTPMCCENVTQSGLVNFGCTNLPLN